MKFSKLFLMLTLVSSLAIYSCKEEDKTPDPTGTNKSKSELITNSNWKLNAATFNPPMVLNFGGNIITITSLLEVLKECEKDNMLMFNTDSTIMVDNGTLKCDGTEPQTKKDGNWKLINNDTQIEITNSEYFKLLSSGDNKVILNNITVSETQLTGDTDYTYTGDNGEVTTKISFIFKK